jgi:hypothetical protein
VIGACFFVTRQPASTLAPFTEQTGIYTLSSVVLIFAGLCHSRPSFP